MNSIDEHKADPEENEPSVPQPSGDHPWIASYPPEIAWETDLEPQPLGHVLEKAAHQYSDLTCTYFLGKTMTYGEVANLAGRIAAGLQSRGIGKGSKVGLLLPNSPTYVASFFGVLMTGATVVNFNPLYTVEELARQVEDSDTELMITLDLAVLFPKVESLIDSGVLQNAAVFSFADLLPPLKSILFGIFKSGDVARVDRSPHSDKIITEPQLIQNDGVFTAPDIDVHEDVAVLQYTGGTTGIPKGAMLTHANLSVNLQQVQLWATNVNPGEECFIAILPFFHVFAMTVILNYGVAVGAELVLMPKFELDDALKLISGRKVSVLPGVPTLFNAMLHRPDISRFDLSSLKFCISGGAALPLEVRRGFESLAGCSLVEGYGLSETSPVATCNPVDGIEKDGSIGIPLAQTYISVRSLDDPSVEMPLGENGEICIKGPQVMKGYWQRPDETRDVFTGDFFRTGDIGYMDEQGFTYIVDRLKDMINCSGFKVYPRQIEEAIYEHPAVEEVTVIGIPDEYRGEAPKAFIKLRDGESADEAAIFAFLEPKLSKIEMPSQIEFRDELPKTMVGKLSRKELREETDDA